MPRSILALLAGKNEIQKKKKRIRTSAGLARARVARVADTGAGCLVTRGINVTENVVEAEGWAVAECAPLCVGAFEARGNVLGVPNADAHLESRDENKKNGIKG